MTITLQPANHFVISGKGINAVVDTMGFGGGPGLVSGPLDL